MGFIDTAIFGILNPIVVWTKLIGSTYHNIILFIECLVIGFVSEFLQGPLFLELHKLYFIIYLSLYFNNKGLILCQSFIPYMNSSPRPAGNLLDGLETMTFDEIATLAMNRRAWSRHINSLCN